MELTKKQEAFVAAYLSNGFNATDAAREAGYGGNARTLAAIGCENLAKPKIKEKVDAELKARSMGADEVLTRLAEQARGSMLDVAEMVQTPEGVKAQISLESAIANGKVHLIRKLKYDKDGNLTVELYSSQVALDLLAKAHRLYSDSDEAKSTPGLDNLIEALRATREKASE